MGNGLKPAFGQIEQGGGLARHGGRNPPPAKKAARIAEDMAGSDNTDQRGFFVLEPDMHGNGPRERAVEPARAFARVVNPVARTGTNLLRLGNQRGAQVLGLAREPGIGRQNFRDIGLGKGHA